MIVVSDSSPVVALARIGRLELLPALYQRIFVPFGVYEELAHPHRRFPLDPKSWPWLTVQSVKDITRVTGLTHLDPGEIEAIALALEINADVVLIDERKGRQSARKLGLRVMGLLGILAEAKRAGIVERIEPIVSDLVDRADFWVDPRLRIDVLRAVGELP